MYFIHSRCLQGNGLTRTDMTTSVRKRVVAYNTNKSQTLDKNQIPEVHSHLGKLCKFNEDKTKFVETGIEICVKNRKSYPVDLSFLALIEFVLFPLWTFFFFWKITIIYMNPGRKIYFSLPENVQTGCTVHPTPHIMTAYPHHRTQLRMSEDKILPSFIHYDIERILPLFTVTCKYSDIYLVYWLKAHYIHTIHKNLW